MNGDEIITDIRRIREEHAEEFNYNVGAILADLRKLQAESGREVVQLPPKRIESPAPAGSAS